MARPKKIKAPINDEALPRFEQIVQDDLLFMKILRIKNKQGRLVPMIPNRAQLHFYQHMTGRDIVLKARQLGFSTFVQALFYKRVTTQFGRSAVTVSHDRVATGKLREKFNTFYKHLPSGLKPAKGKDDKIMTTFPGLESSSYIGTAGNRSFGRGDTLHDVHASEIAFWIDPETLLTGLMEAVPGRNIMPDSTVVLESTANGAQGLFYEMCMEAYRGEGDWKLHFYPWWWLDEYAIPLEKGEVIEPDEEEMSLMQKHELTAEQIKWRRAKKRDIKEKFLQEYPEDEITCFLLSGTPRFDTTALKQRLDEQCRPPVEIWHGGRVRIYHLPTPDTRYVIGADPSQGSGGNAAAAVVRDWRNNIQVASIQARDWEPLEFAMRLIELAVYYNHAYVGVERNNHGHTVISYMQTGTDFFQSYSNVYVHTDGRIGWHTNISTRPVMVDDLAIEYGSDSGYVIRDKNIIQQALAFVYKNSTRSEAKQGSEDDLIFADAIAGQLRLQPLGPSILYGSDEEMATYEGVF